MESGRPLWPERYHLAPGNYALMTQSAEVVSTNDCISSTIPDLCIAYQLYTECGTMINLYDWMQVSCVSDCVSMLTRMFVQAGIV